jgi:hypothetical protein
VKAVVNGAGEAMREAVDGVAEAAEVGRGVIVDRAAEVLVGRGTRGDVEQMSDAIGQARDTVDRTADRLITRVLHVWDGEVGVESGSESVTVKKDETIVAQDGKRITLAGAPPPGMLAARGPRPDRVQVDPALFGGGTSGVEQGLYVWVRDGAVVLEDGGRVVHVAAGNAALATRERVTLLDYVPAFMRVDRTPLPDPAGARVLPPSFVGRDGSIQSCRPG